MAMNRALFRRQLQEGLNAVTGHEYRKYTEQWPRCFPTVETSGKAFEEDVLSIGFGGAQVKPEGAGVAYDTGAESYVSRYHHDTIALAFSITQEAVDDGLYGKLGPRYARELIRALMHTKEIRHAAIFNNGFSASYPGGDGVPLFSVSHPMWGGGVLANRPAVPTDLSETSLENAFIDLAGFVDDRGIPVVITAQSLAIPRQLQFEAERIINTTLRPGTADNDINAQKSLGMLPKGAHVNQRFTDPDAWFLITDCPHGMKHIKRQAVRRGIEGDFETGNMRYKVSERYSQGWTNFRGAWGNPGGGS